MLRSRVKLSCNGLLLCTHSISFKTAKHDPEIKKRDKILSGGGVTIFMTLIAVKKLKIIKSLQH